MNTDKWVFRRRGEHAVRGACPMTTGWLLLRTGCAARLLPVLLLLTLPAVVHAQYTYTTNNGTIAITGYPAPAGM